jgi:hypothetical protein
MPGPLSVMRMRFAPITPPEAEPLGVLVEDEAPARPGRNRPVEAYAAGGPMPMPPRFRPPPWR